MLPSRGYMKRMMKSGAAARFRRELLVLMRALARSSNSLADMPGRTAMFAAMP